MKRSSSQTTLTNPLPQDSSLNYNSSETTDSDSDLTSVLSTSSTLINTNANFKIFNHYIYEFSNVKQLPIISKFLTPGVDVYNSWYDFLNQQQPILTTKTHPFKLNSNFLTIHHFQMNQKTEFCKVDFKIHSNNITYYILTFINNLQIYLIMNNSMYPTIDFSMNANHFRIQGSKGTTSSLGSSNLIQMYVMKDETNLLTEWCEVDSTKKKLKLNNTLYNVIKNKQIHRLKQLICDTTPLINIPIASYIDHGDMKTTINNKKYIDHGRIKMFDYQSGNVTDEMMIICCIMLTLREQEYRKFKGDKKQLSN